ncbi:hypothetical protein LSH36_480g02061 [Paralvinella palmiformis]|uniref:Uncharacterized protein n=1 Tax=Paralvinella palmiformis TaxID=53620 RepID=A0AAD9JA93_9ANNE|nr:hypothetical protein LSH36_480g02061 [Paralvinella palmiformis]
MDPSRAFIILNVLCFVTSTVSQTVRDSRCRESNGVNICLSALSGTTSYSEAVQWCQALGATLPRPHDALEAQDLRGYMSSIGLSNSWIDAKQNKLPWSQVVIFSPSWIPNRPVDDDNYQSCVVLRSSNDYKWDQAPCTQSHAVMCEANIKDVPQGFGCEPIDQDRCILAQNIQQPWYDADKGQEFFSSGISAMLCDSSVGNEDSTSAQYNSICAAFGSGGRLVRVTNSAINDLVTRKARNLGIDVWIGITNRPWINADGNELSYYYWEVNNPSTLTEQCAAATSSIGRWIDVSCSDQLPVLCKGSSLLSTSTTTTTFGATPTSTPSTTTSSASTLSTYSTTVSSQSCGLDPELLTGQAGSFSSPGYPGGYGSDLGCIWQIKTGTAYSGYTIELEFKDLDLDCSAGDHITVYVGTTQNSILGPVDIQNASESGIDPCRILRQEISEETFYCCKDIDRRVWIGLETISAGDQVIGSMSSSAMNPDSCFTG